MKITDLTDAYSMHLISRDNLAEYEATYPLLFEHYNQYWAGSGTSYANLTSRDLERRSLLVSAGLKEAVQAVERVGLSVNSMEAVLFVGKNRSNGHALITGDRIVVWLPVETYTTGVRARVFVMHEIVHALHYSLSPEFYFHSESERLHTGRQLITEGLATLLTAELLQVKSDESLWADYLSAEQLSDWMRQCSTRQSELRQFILSQFDSHSKSIGLFYADDPGDILHYRSGYHVGMQVMREISTREKVSPLKLLDYPRADLEHLTREALATS